MDVIEEQAVTKGRKCRLGRHHYVRIADDNPEMRGQEYQRCNRCGKAKDKNEYGPMSPGQAFGWGGGF